MLTKDSSSNKEYLPGVENTVLCPADNAIYPRCIVHYYYHNKDNSPAFMEFSVLQDSFYQTLRVCLPIALAMLTRMASSEYGGLTMAVDPTMPNYPPVRKHIDDLCTIAVMLAKDFALDSQPSAMHSASPIANPLTGDPLCIVDVVYMADGVGISLAFSHAIVDLPALVRFSKEWSRLAQSMYASDTELYQPQPLNIDRQWFWNAISAQAAPIDMTFDNHLESLKKNNCNSLFPTLKNTQNTDSSVFDDKSSGSTLYRIGISHQSVTKLGLIRSTICPDVSIPNFISAVLWHCIFKSCPESKFSYFATSLTVRTDPMFSGYWGNTATMKYTYRETAELNSMEIGVVACLIQNLVNKYSAAEFAHTINNYSNKKYVQDLTQLVENNNASRLMVSNTSRLSAYLIDFGFEQPVKTAFAPHVPPGFASFFPRSKYGGIDILIRTLPKAIKKLTCDSLIMDYINVISYQHKM